MLQSHVIISTHEQDYNSSIINWSCPKTGRNGLAVYKNKHDSNLKYEFVGLSKNKNKQNLKWMTEPITESVSQKAGHILRVLKPI
jgi:hypothetical protein